MDFAKLHGRSLYIFHVSGSSYSPLETIILYIKIHNSNDNDDDEDDNGTGPKGKAEKALVLFSEAAAAPLSDPRQWGAH